MNITGCAEGYCHGVFQEHDCKKLGNLFSTSPSTQLEEERAVTSDWAKISAEARQLCLQNSEAGARQTEKVSIDSAENVDGEELSHHEHGEHEHLDEDDHENQKRNNILKNELNQAEKMAVRDLQAKDRQVRAHEQAHVAASGRISVSAPMYEYETGPDGRRYAVGGSVNYNVPQARTPEEEKLLAQQLRQMALAPMDPSPKDRSIAAEASVKESKATREIIQDKMEKQTVAIDKMHDCDQGNKNESDRADVSAELFIQLVARE